MLPHELKSNTLEIPYLPQNEFPKQQNIHIVCYSYWDDQEVAITFWKKITKFLCMLECIYVYSYVCRYVYVCIQVSTHVMHSWNTKPINSKILITLFQDNFTEFFLANSIFFFQWDALWKLDLMRENFSHFKHRQGFIIHLKIEHDTGFIIGSKHPYEIQYQ